MKIGDDEIICDKCNGTGKIEPYEIKIIIPGLDLFSSNDVTEIIDTCDKCSGVGKLDWVENAIGSKHIPIPWIMVIKESDEDDDICAKVVDFD